MNLFSIIGIAIGLAMDAFSVSIAKGLAVPPRHIFKNALLLAISFGVFQGFMPLIGYFAGIHFADYIVAFDHWIAFILLSYIGFHMIKEASSIQEDEIICFHQIKLKELFLLSLATSIDALVLGVSFAFLKVDIITVSIWIASVTSILCFIGVYIGRYLGNKLQRYAHLLGGVVLLALGVKTLIEHLFVS